MWIQETKLHEIWYAIAEAPLTTNLESLNKHTAESDKLLSAQKLRLAFANRRAFVVNLFKPAAMVIAEHMFPDGQRGLEFANLKVSTMIPETERRMEMIRRESFSCKKKIFRKVTKLRVMFCLVPKFSTQWYR
jgi:hypothetical protein